MGDDYYDVKFENYRGTTAIVVEDIQKQAPLDPKEHNKFLTHYDLMLLENIIDIVHDVVAEGSLSYN